MMPGIRAGRLVVGFVNDDPADLALNLRLPVLMSLGDIIVDDLNPR